MKIRYFKLWLSLEHANLKARTTYLFNFVVGIVSVSILGLSTVFITWIITRQIPVIGGWNFYQMLFIYSMWRVSHALFNIFGNHISSIDYFLREGQLDRLLVRPLPVLFSFFTLRINIGGIGDLLAGLTGLYYAYSHIFEWHVATVFLILFLSINGAVIEWSLFTMIASLAFWTLQSNGLRSIMETFLYTFTRFPQNIYSIKIQLIMTFIFPIGFMSFYPSQALFGNTESTPFFQALAYLSPLVAILMATLTVWIWNQGMKVYKGAGS